MKSVIIGGCVFLCVFIWGWIPPSQPPVAKDQYLEVRCPNGEYFTWDTSAPDSQEEGAYQQFCEDSQYGDYARMSDGE